MFSYFLSCISSDTKHIWYWWKGAFMIIDPLICKFHSSFFLISCMVSGFRNQHMPLWIPNLGWYIIYWYLSYMIPLWSSDTLSILALVWEGSNFRVEGSRVNMGERHWWGKLINKQWIRPVPVFQCDTDVYSKLEHICVHCSVLPCNPVWNFLSKHTNYSIVPKRRTLHKSVINRGSFIFCLFSQSISSHWSGSSFNLL